MTADSPVEAMANADTYTSYDVGMCLKYVRGPCWEVGSFYASAIDAWNGSAKKHPGDRHPPAGAPLFYSGGTYGHVVIAKGGDRMRSTDCTSSSRVSDADLDWPVDTWGDTYLGWTGDLNGVDLPLDVEDDDMPYSDWPSKDRKALADDVAEAVWTELLKGQDTAPDGRHAGSTLSGVRNLVENVADDVWSKLLGGQDSAPDGRKAGSTLSGIRNLVERIAKATDA